MPININSVQNILKSQLKDIGYFNIEIKEENERRFDVIAEGTLRSIFLVVIVYLVSEHFRSLTKKEISHIKENAITFNKEPWAAVMKVNEKGELVDGIQWTNLSKQELIG